MQKNIENIIIKTLLKNEDYARKVLPFIKEEYLFGGEKIIYQIIYNYFEKYGKPPTIEAINIEASALKLEQTEVNSVDEVLTTIDFETDVDLEWLTEHTEKFCQEKAIYNALNDSIAIYQGQDKKRDRGAIPQILSDALAISFDPRVGHDYLEEGTMRYDFYHRQNFKIPFDLDMMNEITKGGVEKKTLNVVMAGVGVGKSMFLCHLASHYVTMGLNVLYITMEMAEEKIAQRVDANLMDITLDELATLPRIDYEKCIDKVKAKVKGKLIVKEYPTGAAHVGHFRHLLNELRLKKNFVPEVIIIDYINICASSRLKKSTGSADLSNYVKAIAEEFRGLGVEFGVPIWTATQVNRAGFDNSDPSMTDTGESWGIPATADFHFVLVTSDTLEKLKQLMVKQLKNRYNDVALTKRFALGVDKAKMRFYNLDSSAQNNITDSGDVDIDPKDERLAISKAHGSAPYESGYKIRRFGKGASKKKFSDFKVGTEDGI